MEVVNYNGHPCIVLAFFQGKQRSEFCFGVRRAQAILDNLDDIRQFVKENSGKAKVLNASPDENIWDRGNKMEKLREPPPRKTYGRIYPRSR